MTTKIISASMVLVALAMLILYFIFTWTLPMPGDIVFKGVEQPLFGWFHIQLNVIVIVSMMVLVVLGIVGFLLPSMFNKENWRFHFYYGGICIGSILVFIVMLCLNNYLILSGDIISSDGGVYYATPHYILIAIVQLSAIFWIGYNMVKWSHTIRLVDEF
jgi:hypothetical protein